MSKPRTPIRKPAPREGIADPYLHRAYAARDQMRSAFVFEGCASVMHPCGGYCLDRIDADIQGPYYWKA